jgi:hypothetical protein
MKLAWSMLAMVSVPPRVADSECDASQQVQGEPLDGLMDQGLVQGSAAH